MSLAGLEYTTIKEISGPLLFVESVRGVGYGELARIKTPSGEERRGQVLEIGGGVAVVQVFEGTTGLDVGKTRVRFSDEPFTTIFAAMGITADELRYFRDDFEKQGAFDHVTMFVNLADDPAIERILTPRLALTAAEYFAIKQGNHVLVILTDMTNYAE